MPLVCLSLATPLFSLVCNGAEHALSHASVLPNAHNPCFVLSYPLLCSLSHTCDGAEHTLSVVTVHTRTTKRTNTTRNHKREKSKAKITPWKKRSEGFEFEILFKEFEPSTTQTSVMGLLDEQLIQLEELQDDANPNFFEEIVTLYYHDSSRLISNLEHSLKGTHWILTSWTQLCISLKEAAQGSKPNKLGRVKSKLLLYQQEHSTTVLA
ncbi:Histidine-containing phosphotransfer protein 4, partial [Mucuna pruriens]